MLLLLSFALIGYSSYRAYSLSFTHDEALSFTIAKGEGWSQAQTANNHPLNTKLMTVAAKLFGDSELALRLPNVLAHLLYLVFGFLLIKRIRTSFMRFAAFVFLNCNPFLLDFFGLARGYGLAIGFMMLAVYLLVRAWEEPQANSRRTIVFLAASMLAALLSDWSNYTMLNVHFGLFTAAVFRFFYSDSKFSFGKKHLKSILIFSLLQIACWFPLFRELVRLKKAGELYYGGSSGFISDTIHSLIDSTAYVDIPIGGFVKLLLTIGILILFFIALFFSVRHLRKNGKPELADLAGIVLLMLILTTVLEAWFLESLYPRDRTALAFIPLYFIFVFASFARENAVRWSQVYFLSLGLFFLFQSLFCLNFKYTLSWRYDSFTKSAMLQMGGELKADHSGKMFKAGNSWQLEPVLNYYRNRFHLEKNLEPFARDRMDKNDNDFVYVLSEDAPKIDPAIYRTVRVNRLTGTYAFRRVKR